MTFLNRIMVMTEKTNLQFIFIFKTLVFVSFVKRKSEEVVGINYCKRILFIKNIFLTLSGV